MIELRPYQQDIYERARLSMEAGHRAPLIVSPCGSGKTVIFCFLAWKVSEKGNSVLILTHREELLEQISETLDAFGLKHSFIAANRPYNKRRQIQLASVMTLARRLEKGWAAGSDDEIRMPDLIIPDEAHHSVATAWKRIWGHWPRVRRLGVTATPERLDGEPLGDVFDDMILGPTAGDLIKMGMLSDYHIIAPPVDWSKVGVKNGDFVKKELAKAVQKSTITGDAVLHYNKFAAGKRAVAFCIDVAEAKNTAEQFQKAGFRAASIDGAMERGARKELVKLFRGGFLDVLTSADLISEGFDLPAIECGIMLRPTASLALWIQQFGRTLRPFPGKEKAIILDHSGNTMRHMWLPEMEWPWSLKGRNKVKAEKDTAPAVVTCPYCHTAQFESDQCKTCGTVFVKGGPSESKGPQKVDGELQALELEKLREAAAAKKMQQGRAKTLAELTELFRTRGEKNAAGHAAAVFYARHKKQMAGGGRGRA